MTEPKKITIAEEVDVLRARKAAREMAAAAGFDEIRVTEIEIAVSELGLNIVKHAGVRGELVLGLVKEEDQVGFELVARDGGAGIADPLEALRDGQSSAGTLGIGLSGVKRLMDEFTLDSSGARGTQVTVRRWLPNPLAPVFRYSVLSRPKPGEFANGDGYFIRHTRDGIFCAVIDALGHGSEAAEVTRRALEILELSYREPLEQIVQVCHAGLRHTRGAALGLCRVRARQRVVQHLSIGNVELRILRPEPQHTISYNGTLGMHMESHRTLETPYLPGYHLVLFSDGISGKFEAPPQLLGRAPIELASYIFNNHRRDYDDATVLVLNQVAPA